jgi:diadenosine tetraphosphatase ApaH/serine/threonine PP2A family protein phosphatase
VRIAVLADIHGNVLALEAVLDDLGRHGGADVVVDLGDCVSGPLWPAETMARLKALEARTVRGNHDRIVGLDDAAAMGASDRVAYDALAPEDRARLAALPETLSIDDAVLAFHARLSNDSAYLLDRVHEGRLVRAPIEDIRGRLGDVGPVRLCLCAHSHRPDLVAIPCGPLVLNPGSVGCPAYDDPAPPRHVSESGAPHARYAIVTVPPAAAIHVDMLAVPYDHEAAARRAEAFGRPEWAAALRFGLRPNPLPKV